MMANDSCYLAWLLCCLPLLDLLWALAPAQLLTWPREHRVASELGICPQLLRGGGPGGIMQNVCGQVVAKGLSKQVWIAGVYTVLIWSFLEVMTSQTIPSLWSFTNCSGRTERWNISHSSCSDNCKHLWPFTSVVSRSTACWCLLYIAGQTVCFRGPASFIPFLIGKKTEYPSVLDILACLLLCLGVGRFRLPDNLLSSCFGAACGMFSVSVWGQSNWLDGSGFLPRSGY